MTNHDLFTQVCRGNPSAVAFLEMMTEVLHLWDDLIDGDKPRTLEDINRAFEAALIWLPRNVFYREHFDLLNPVLMIAIQNWHTANLFERQGSRTDKEVAYIIRSSYVDLVTMTALIIGGEQWARQAAPVVRRHFHAETFKGYLKNLAAEKAARGGQ